MFVHKIETTFMRKRKPADYEGVDNSVTLGATLDEGDDWRACARELVDEAAIIVYTRIGMKEAAKPVFTAEIKEGKATVVVQDGGTAVTAPTGTVVSAAPAETAEPAKRTRRTKAQIEADEAAAKARGNISANPEDRKDPTQPDIPETTTAPAKATPVAASGADIPEDAAPAKATPAKETPAPAPATGADIPETTTASGDELTDKELQQFVIDKVSKDKSIAPEELKSVMEKASTFVRMGDIKDGKVRMAVKKAIEAFIASGASKMAKK